METGYLNTGTNKLLVDIKDLNTPCYIIDKTHLDKNVDYLFDGITEGWNGDVAFGYSIKTNSLPWIITYMKNRGFMAEVVSKQEYRFAKMLGFKDAEIILTSSVKTDHLLVESLNGGAIINIDNFAEIEMIERSIERATTRWKVGLRYNFALELHCPGADLRRCPSPHVR